MLIIQEEIYICQQILRNAHALLHHHDSSIYLLKFSYVHIDQLKKVLLLFQTFNLIIFLRDDEI